MKTQARQGMWTKIKAWLPGGSDTTKVLFAIIFLTMVFLPLASMLLNITSDSIDKVLHSPQFGKALVNSLVSTAISTLITLVIAFLLSICLERIQIRFKAAFSILITLPMLIPSISHGMGLVILFGNNGVLTNLLHLNFSVYGMGGIITGSVLYALPVAFLMISDILRYEDYSPYEAAEILGLSKWHRFKAISLPYLRKPLVAVLFSTFTMIFTDYGVPLMVGGKYTTLPTVMYQEVIGALDFGKGSVYGVILLIPAIVAFIIDLLNKDRGNSAFVIKPYPHADSTGKKIAAYIGFGLASLFVLLPIVSFGILAFSTNYPKDTSFTLDHILGADKRMADYLTNSVTIALLVSVIGVIIAFITAYLSARMKSKLSRFLHLSSITSAAIPGIVLGLAYVLTFKGMPIYGTIMILVMVNTVHFIASPYLMIYNSFSKINENLEDVAATMGIRRYQMLRDVFIPQCKGTIIEMFSYFFVNCMMTISAVSFLFNTSNKPLSLMLTQFEAQMQLEGAAVVSLIILLVNLLMKGIAHLIKTHNLRALFKKRSRRKDNHVT